MNTKDRKTLTLMKNEQTTRESNSDNKIEILLRLNQLSLTTLKALFDIGQKIESGDYFLPELQKISYEDAPEEDDKMMIIKMKEETTTVTKKEETTTVTKKEEESVATTTSSKEEHKQNSSPYYCKKCQYLLRFCNCREEKEEKRIKTWKPKYQDNDLQKSTDDKICYYKSEEQISQSSSLSSSLSSSSSSITSYAKIASTPPLKVIPLNKEELDLSEETVTEPICKRCKLTGHEIDQCRVDIKKKCTKCLKFGHFSTICGIMCSFCGKVGHFEANCQLRYEESELL